jgi:hypothetical protein
VYDGRRCIGHIVCRGKVGFETFTDDISIGAYPDAIAAADAISAAAGRTS